MDFSNVKQLFCRRHCDITGPQKAQKHTTSWENVQTSLVDVFSPVSSVFNMMISVSSRLARSDMSMEFPRVRPTACSSLQYCSASSHVFNSWTRIKLSSIHRNGWLWVHLSISKYDPFFKVHHWTLIRSSAEQGKRHWNDMIPILYQKKSLSTSLGDLITVNVFLISILTRICDPFPFII